ncbi:MAG: MBL fold metallo-hydrolase [Bacteroidetes bacterium]|nr:MBL fold metallo-hydrolase [Bacteroidota bacterium]HET6243301.1 MBL fold metallo-hydrolase [Bacteroidia bacterium]
MIQIDFFTFNPFQENTYILYDETKECIIVDPGCYSPSEKRELADFIKLKELKPVMLVLTHAHIDHVLGNDFIHKTYGLTPIMNAIEIPGLRGVSQYGHLYGIHADPSPEPESFIDEGDNIKFGNSSLKVLFTPGHSAGSVSLYNDEQKFIIAGDVLFQGSIGRTDLPGGDFDTLIASIKNKLFPLGDDFKVYSGHGPATNIGIEKKNNPFLK